MLRLLHATPPPRLQATLYGATPQHASEMKRGWRAGWRMVCTRSGGGTAGGGCMLGLAGGLGDIDIEVEVVIWDRRVQRR